LESSKDGQDENDVLRVLQNQFSKGLARIQRRGG
jgi:hypothetical protein